MHFWPAHDTVKAYFHAATHTGQPSVPQIKCYRKHGKLPSRLLSEWVRMKSNLVFRQTLTLWSTNIIKITFKNSVLISHRIGYWETSITETNCKLFRCGMSMFAEITTSNYNHKCPSHLKHILQTSRECVWRVPAQTPFAAASSAWRWQWKLQALKRDVCMVASS